MLPRPGSAPRGPIAGDQARISCCRQCRVLPPIPAGLTVPPLLSDRLSSIIMQRRSTSQVLSLPCSPGNGPDKVGGSMRSEEHPSELQSLMRISYAVFCLKIKNITLLHITHLSNYQLLSYI